MSCDFGDFGDPRAISDTGRSNAQRFAFQLVDAGNFLINASLAIFVEEVSLVYVAYDGDIEVVSIRFVAWRYVLLSHFHPVSSRNNKYYESNWFSVANNR